MILRAVRGPVRMQPVSPDRFWSHEAERMPAGIPNWDERGLRNLQGPGMEMSMHKLRFCNGTAAFGSGTETGSGTSARAWSWPIDVTQAPRM